MLYHVWGLIWEDLDYEGLELLELEDLSPTWALHSLVCYLSWDRWKAGSTGTVGWTTALGLLTVC